MIERHQDKGQVATYVFSKTHRVAEGFERRPIARARGDILRPDRSTHLNWEILAIWSFVVFSFAALLFCVCVIYAKCQANSPF